MTPTDPDPAATELARLAVWLRLRAEYYRRAGKLESAQRLERAADVLERGEQP